MAKALETWTVFPHGPVEKIFENLWRVEARVPGAPLNRQMVVARMKDGRLVIHNAIALEDAGMKDLEAWGTPSILIVPNGSHRLDAKIFKDRYPALRVLGPPGGKAKIEEVVKVDATEGAFGDETVCYDVLQGTGGREGVLTVKSSAGTTLVFNDALMNMPRLPGFGGMMMGVFGFTSRAPKVTGPARLMLVKDKKALKADLERRASTPALVRIEMGHGVPVTKSPADAIRGAAAEL